MTDRVRCLTVVLDHDYREDDLDAILTAIGQIRSVREVLPIVVTPSELVGRMTMRCELEPEIFKAVADVFDKHRAGRGAEP